MFDLRETPLSDYTRKEDIANSITHIIGALFIIIAGIILIAEKSMHLTARQNSAIVIYILSTLLVFAGSAVYHGLNVGFAKQVARIVDHSNIFVMISGSVTAFILLALYHKKPGYSTAVIIIMWAITIVGIFLTFMDFKKFKSVQIVMYVVIGWAAILAMKDIIHEPAGMDLAVKALIGGCFITVGTVIYAIGKKIRYCHCVFHSFVVFGSVSIYLGMFNYVGSLIK